MKKTTMNQVCNLSPGILIVGKWNGNTYKIVRQLGQGATGCVYLADSYKGKVAIKLSENSLSITSEVNVLKHFSKVQGTALGPSLLDVDDWRYDKEKIVSFYVMEYVQGNNLLEFVNTRGLEWVDVLTLQLLSNLDNLHQQGWVFGDLKPENLIVTGPPPKVRCIDVGGTTQQGRSIKEFTEFYDRGYWGLGTRKAEPSYDLFAVAMVIINAAYPNRFKKDGNREGKVQLFERITQHHYLLKHEEVLQKALLGKYNNAIEMKADFVNSFSKNKRNTKVYKSVIKPTSKKQNVSQPSTNQTRKQTKNVRKRKKSNGILETLIILVGVFIVYSLYVYHYLM